MSSCLDPTTPCVRRARRRNTFHKARRKRKQRDLRGKEASSALASASSMLWAMACTVQCAARGFWDGFSCFFGWGGGG